MGPNKSGPSNATMKLDPCEKAEKDEIPPHLSGPYSLILNLDKGKCHISPLSYCL